jgi:outer membrane protein assembly factor BamB
MNRIVALLLIGLLALAGCESLFGKEQSQRGALAGKRVDVFSQERMLKKSDDKKGVVVAAPAETEIAEWPQPGGSTARVHENAKLAQNPQKAFSLSVGKGSFADGVLAATPILYAGKIYTIDSEGKISAFSSTDGARVWQKYVPEAKAGEDEPPRKAGAGLATDGKTLVATLSDGHVVALDLISGKVLWQRMVLSPVRGAPVIAGDDVFVVTMSNTLQQLSLKDGSLGWSHSGIQEAASILGMASPLVTPDVVIAPYSSGEIFALRRVNGQMVWQENLAGLQAGGTLPAMADIQGHPVLDGDRVYVGSHSGRLVALDVKGGRRVWENDAGSLQMPWVAGDYLFILTIESQLAALDKTDGHVIWTQDLPRYVDPQDRTEAVVWAGPVLAGGKLWLTNSLGELKAYKPQDGKEIYSQSGFSPIFMPPIVAGHTLYVLDDSGTLTALR